MLHNQYKVYKFIWSILIKLGSIDVVLVSSSSWLKDLGSPLQRGSSVRRLRRCAATLPVFLERTFLGSISFSAFGYRGDGGGVGVDGKKICSPGFIIGVELVVVCRLLRRLPTVKGPDVHRRRRYRRQFVRPWWLRAVIVIYIILCMSYHRQCCQDVERIGRQVQVIQARWNHWKLQSKSLWHRGLIWVVMDCQDLRFGGCDQRDWGHPCCVGLRYFFWSEDTRRVFPLRTGLIGYLFHKEQIRSTRGNRKIGGHVEFRKMSWIIPW